MKNEVKYFDLVKPILRKLEVEEKNLHRIKAILTTKTLTSRFAKGKPWNYDIENPGYNYRLDEIRASLGISQMKRIKKMNSLRKKAANYYTEKLGNVNGIIIPDKSINAEHVHHLYVIRITKEYSITRDVLFQKLLKKILTLAFFLIQL